MLKKTSIMLLLAILMQLFSFMTASASPNFTGLAANSGLLIEKDSGIILFEQNIHVRYPADSLTKIMTLLLAAIAVESGEISDNEIIEMTDSAWLDISENSTTQNIQPGQTMTFIDLMYSAYVGSANEACNMIALRIAGNINAFVRMMNDKAAELGCENTRFTNPHGEYHDNQVTTAYDMYLIYSEALKSELFTEISSTFRHITERTNDDGVSRTLASTNYMLNQSSTYYYRYCMTGIASATYEGGYSLVTSAEEEGLSLISVILGSNAVINEDESVTLRNFTETYRLLMWGFENYNWREILKVTDLLARVPILHGSGADFVNVRPEKPLVLLMDVSIPLESFTFDITIFSEESDTPLVAPIKTGDHLGDVVISKDGEIFDTIALVANTNIELNGVEFMRRQISDLLSTKIARNIITALIVIVVIYAALVIRYNIMRINRIRRIKNAKEELIRERYDNYKDR